jgi:protein involved in polysaccharide export with SLBB domain
MKATFVVLLLLAPLLGTMRPQSPDLGQQGIPSDSEDKRICVLGNVRKPSLLPFRSGITVTQAIKEAGGIPQDSKNKKVRVYSQTTEGTNRIIYVDLEVVRRKPYMDLELQSFDIVEVLSSTEKKKKLAAVQYNPCFSLPLKKID